jgi:hypothetical protein
MGMLDDAIREHLELKRRSGTSDAEVHRLEEEALGPPRRAAEPEAHEPEVTEAPAQAPAEPVEEHEPEPAAAPEPPQAHEPEAWLEDDELEEGPQATSEFTAADVAEAHGERPSDYVAPDEEGEDLLEETPEFLQETPEHDRLWFEQRPPRDFDFDE